MTDLEFVQKCIKGDKQSWNEFIEKYSRLIYNYINYILKQRNSSLFTQENTSDIFQDIFLSLFKDNFKKLRSFKARNGCSLATWLRQVTINHTLDYARKSKPAVSLEEEDGEQCILKDLIVDKAVSAEIKAGAEEKLLLLKDCIENLDIDDKFFLEFHVNRNLSLEAIKEVFKVSRGAIDMRKSRIIDRLRECFRTKGFTFR